MHYKLLPLLSLPLYALAQSSSGNQTAQTRVTSVVTSTSLSTFITVGPSRSESTGVSTFVFTTTVVLNGTSSGNSTTPANQTSSSTTTTSKNLPTAPTNVNGGGGSNGAPIPGATGVNGAYGPGDGYTAAATSLKQNALVVGLAGVLIGGALVFV